MDDKRNPYIRQAVYKFSLMNLKALLKESVGFKTFAFLNVNLDIAHQEHQFFVLNFKKTNFSNQLKQYQKIRKKFRKERMSMIVGFWQGKEEKRGSNSWGVWYFIQIS